MPALHLYQCTRLYYLLHPCLRYICISTRLYYLLQPCLRYICISAHGCIICFNHACVTFVSVHTVVLFASTMPALLCISAHGCIICFNHACVTFVTVHTVVLFASTMPALHLYQCTRLYYLLQPCLRYICISAHGCIICFNHACVTFVSVYTVVLFASTMPALHLYQCTRLYYLLQPCLRLHLYQCTRLYYLLQPCLRYICISVHGCIICFNPCLRYICISVHGCNICFNHACVTFGISVHGCIICFNHACVTFVSVYTVVLFASTMPALHLYQCTRLYYLIHPCLRYICISVHGCII